MATQAANQVLIRNAKVFDGVADGLVDGHVLVDGDKIASVSPQEPSTAGATVIDAGERVLMPGLTDAHVHLMGMSNTVLQLHINNMGLIFARTLAEAEKTLLRGFTTVRDMGGDVVGVKQAIDEGLAVGPRIYPSQAMVSQTSGHGDFGLPYDPTPSLGGPPSRGDRIGFTRVADGPERVLAAVREQLKVGASQIKLMAGGGVASFYDHLDTEQFIPDEMRAAVQAATDWGTYVGVHVYNKNGVRRAIEAGVRSIEHGHLVDEETVKFMADHDVWLSTQPWAEHDHNFPDPARAEKNRRVCEGVEQLYAWAQKYGVKTAYGTDILFEPDASDRQITMFPRLAEFMTPVEALRMATSGNAELFHLSGEQDPYGEARLGVIEPEAWADLLVVDGDPTKDLSILADYHNTLVVIMKGGQIHKNTLEPAAEHA